MSFWIVTLHSTSVVLAVCLIIIFFNFMFFYFLNMFTFSGYNMGVKLFLGFCLLCDLSDDSYRSEKYT